jgi:hypothetical protein
VNKQPNAVTRPPIAAVTRVDFRRQMETIKGEIISDVNIDKAPNHPKINSDFKWLVEIDL